MVEMAAVSDEMERTEMVETHGEQLANIPAGQSYWKYCQYVKLELSTRSTEFFMGPDFQRPEHVDHAKKVGWLINSQTNISTTVELIDMRFGLNIHGPQKINPTDFSSSATSRLE